MKRPTKRRKWIAVGAALTALAAGALWYGRTYPPALAGTYVGRVSDSPDSVAELTLRPGGHGYLKLYENLEQPITWQADGDRILIHGDTPLIARRVSANNIDLDLGIMAHLHREE